MVIRGLVLVLLLAACSPGTDGDAGGGNGGYQEEYGGSAAVYAQIAADTDCSSLQASFDQAAANNDVAEPGTDQHRWTTGYMAAADDRMQAIGCY